MFKSFRIHCDKATEICDKSQYNEASFFEKLQLYMHFFRCKFCALYTKQNTTMTALYKMKSADCKKQGNCLSEKDKQRIKSRLKELKTR